MAGLAFNVKIGPWSADGYGPFVDAVSIDDAPPELVRLAAHAHSAGVIEVTEGLDETAFQSQEDGEAALAAAQGDWVEGERRPDGTQEPGRWSGGWHDGSLAQHQLDEARKALAAAEAGGDQEDVDEARAALEAVDADIQTRFGGEAA